MSKNQKLREEVVVLRQHLKEARSEITFLKIKIDAMAQRMFGKKSEQLDSAQLTLLLSGLEAADTSEESKTDPDEEEEHQKKKKRRPRTGEQAIRTPEDLEVIEEVIIPEKVQANPEDWKEISREQSKRLDFQPGKFFWRLTTRPKYVLRGDKFVAPIVATAPEGVAVGGMAAPGLLSYMLVSRFCDHLPYYRQQQMFLRANQVWISRQQMVQWTEQSVRLLEDVVEVMREELRRQPYIQVDETPVRFQDRDRSGGCFKGWLWTGLDPGRSVVFHWDQSRGNQALIKLIGEDYQGNIGVDGHSAYSAYAQNRPNVKRLRCWAHLRRKFIEAKAQDPRVAGWILNQIDHLYAWERELRNNRSNAAERVFSRNATSRMVVERLEQAFGRLLSRYRPKEGMGQAIGYALGDWQAFTRFLECGEAEIDSNLVENAIRPSALGKKNWLFIGHPNAGQRSAVIYSLTETCRMLGINPYDYLNDLLTRLPSTNKEDVHLLTPANWLKSQTAILSKAA